MGVRRAEARMQPTHRVRILEDDQDGVEKEKRPHEEGGEVEGPRSKHEPRSLSQRGE